MKTISKCVLSILAGSFFLSTTALQGCDSNKENEAPYELEAGIWGSQEARLQVKETGATVTFSCAMGNIDQKILVDSEGEFEAAGTLVVGPLALPARPARFEGRISGNQLTLVIEYTDTSNLFGTFELTKDFDSEVFYICVC